MKNWALPGAKAVKGVKARCKSAGVKVMIGVPTPGLYFGHSMPSTLPKLPKLNIYTTI
jgi:hypothetical protein